MKKYLFFAICLLVPAAAFSMEFVIAPFYFIDESADQGFPLNDYNEKLLRELGKTAADKGFSFRTLSPYRHNPPQSVSDAIILCRSMKVDFLIYGYITKKDRTIHGELRLLDYGRREVIANFFAMDGNDREEGLMRDLADRVLRFIQETYHIEIIPELPSFAHVQFPIGIGYWLPANKEWSQILYGITRVDGGIQFIPNDRLITALGAVYYVSVGLDISYRLGKARYYEAWNHGFIINAPVLLHRGINEEHEAYVGFGMFYSWDLLHIKKPYEDPTTELFAAMGLMFKLGWNYRFKENIYFFADLRFDISFYESNMIAFAPRAGIMLRKHTKEVVKKW